MSELLTLLDRAQNGDNDACQQVLTENVGLIWSIVKRYSGCGVDTDDLYQLGCIGFIKAVKGFDLTYGTQFSTYAVPKIAGEIRRFLRDDGSVKVGGSSCAMVADTDVGFADAIVKKLAVMDPEHYEQASQRLQIKARRAMERREEQARHEKNLRRGKKRTAPPEPPQPVQEPPREAAKEKPRRPARPGRRRPAAPQQRFAGSRPVKKGKGSGRDRKKS